MGSIYYKYRKDDMSLTYNTIDKVLDSCDNKTLPGPLARYYFSMFYLYRQDKLEKKDLINSYMKLSNLANYHVKNETKYSKYYKSSMKNVNKVFFTIVGKKCDNIEETFKKLYEKRPNDFKLKKVMSRALKLKGCEDSELLLKIEKDIYNNDPTPGSAYSIGQMEVKKENYSSALNYLEESISLADSLGASDKKQLKYIELTGRVALREGQSKKAYNLAEKALEIDENYGKA
ncbi:MAG: tetratricopeptide repeat protein, partial [Flavobacteriales bacterium]